MQVEKVGGKSIKFVAVVIDPETNEHSLKCLLIVCLTTQDADSLFPKLYKQYIEKFEEEREEDKEEEEEEGEKSENSEKDNDGTKDSQKTEVKTD